MSKYSFNKKGAALIAVLTVILITFILANIVLNIISSQARLTRHQINRIQAYYAAQAGMVLAMERLRTGAWSPPPAPTASRLYCINCRPATCPACTANINDNTIAVAPGGALLEVQINIFRQGLDPPPPGPGGGSAIANTSPIRVTVDYTYTP